MSIQAFPTPTQTEQGDQATAELRVDAAEPIIDALPLLDHRTRTQAISPSLAPRGYYLELQDGEQTAYVPLQQRITHIGRGFTADLRLEQAHVSVSHAILVRHGRFMRVLDNRSSNGTFVNGRRIVATNLTDGDVLRVGPVVMRYVVVS
jgi:pSer/pThr/pTyr-binding forkhead associated (FHA) protein